MRYPDRGHRLLAAREHAGLTQDELCEGVNRLPGPELKQGHYSFFETGRHKPESDDLIGRIAKVLNVDVGWLAHGTNAPDWYAPPVKHTHGGVAPETHHTTRRDNKKRREG